MATLGGNTVQIVIEGVDKTAAAAKTSVSNLDKIGAMALKAAAGLIALGSIRSLASLGREAIDTADQMGKLAQQAGATTEFMSALTYHAGLNEVATEGVKRGVKELNESLAKNDAVFQTLGISVRESNGALKSVEAILPQVADRFADMADGAQKSELATKLFGKAGIDLIPMLNQGAKGLQDATEEARKFGLIVSKEAAKNADEFNDNLAKLAATGKGFAMAVTSELLPVLVKWSGTLLELIERSDILRKSADFADITLEGLSAVWEMLTKVRGGWEEYQKVIDGAVARILIPETITPEQSGAEDPQEAMIKRRMETMQQWWDLFRDVHMDTMSLHEREMFLEDELNEKRMRAIDDLSLYHSDALMLREMEERRHVEAVARINEEQSKRMLMTYSKNFNTMGDVFGNFASLAQAIGKKNNAAFKALMYVQAVVSTAAGITRALAEHAWPYSLVIAASIAAAGAAQIAVISQAGAAHGGLSFVPNDQTMQLSAGERVISPRQNTDLTDFLAGNSGGGNSGRMEINLQIDGEVFARAVGDMSRDGRLEIAARAVR